MEEKKLYTQEEVDLITGSVYAEAYNAGLNDNGYKPQTGAAWVKASERLPEKIGRITWRWLDKAEAYSGYTGKGFIYGTGGASVDPTYYSEIEWLDESVTPAAAREEGKLTQSRADLIREANNRDLDGVAINLDELWDEHSEYIDDDIDSLSRWAGSSVVDKEQFRTMVAQLWELFKQQKEK